MLDKETIQELIRVIPRWIIGALALSVIAYVFSLSAVAVFTERNVKFWPPEIGPGPKANLVDEASRMRHDIATMETNLQERLRYLQQNLAEARSRAATSKGSANFMESYEWSSVASRYERDIDRFNDDYLKAISALNDRILAFEEKLKRSNLLCQ